MFKPYPLINSKFNQIDKKLWFDLDKGLSFIFDMSLWDLMKVSLNEQLFEELYDYVYKFK